MTTIGQTIDDLEKQAMVVQSVVCSKDQFETVDEAKKWIKDHGFKTTHAGKGPDETGTSWRFRQRDPGDFDSGSFRTIELTDGVSAVVGQLKETKIMKTDDIVKSVERGDALLLPLGLERDQIHTLELSRSAFKTLAASKAWVANHGFTTKGKPAATQNVFAFVVGDERLFSGETLREESLSRTVKAFVGDVRDDPPVEDPPSDDLVTPSGEPTFESDDVQRVTKRGEIVVISKADEDPEDAVRFMGIVSKPEVPDVEGDVISAEEIRQANDLFMREFQTIGFMHKKDVSSAVKIIQNVIAPIDFEFPLPDGTTKSIAAGTWYQELYTDDPELVKRVRGGQITGLSIGGVARREPVTEMVEGRPRQIDSGLSPAYKRAVDSYISKAEGDPALARFHDLRVEEVSLVDAAANEEIFFVVKRKESDMQTKENQTAAVVKTEPTTQPAAAPVTNANSVPAPSTPPAATPEPTVAAAIETPVATTPEAPKADPAPVTKDANEAVLKALEAIGSRLDGIEKTIGDHGVAIEKASTLHAVAKGQSVPDAPVVVAAEPQSVSKWAGTAIHSVFGSRNPA